MVEGLKILAGIINNLHDLVVSITRLLGLHLTDKDLHFIVFGAIGIIIFIISDFIFRRVVRWNVSILSLIYTFTVLLVLMFGLEIEQGLTGSGNVEFNDVIAGLWGFLALFGILVMVRVLIYLAKKIYGKI